MAQLLENVETGYIVINKIMVSIVTNISWVSMNLSWCRCHPDILHSDHQRPNKHKTKGTKNIATLATSSGKRLSNRLL